MASRASGLSSSLSQPRAAGHRVPAAARLAPRPSLLLSLCRVPQSQPFDLRGHHAPSHPASVRHVAPSPRGLPARCAPCGHPVSPPPRPLCCYWFLQRLYCLPSQDVNFTRTGTFVCFVPPLCPRSLEELLAHGRRLTPHSPGNRVKPAAFRAPCHLSGRQTDQDSFTPYLPVRKAKVRKGSDVCDRVHVQSQGQGQGGAQTPACRGRRPARGRSDGKLGARRRRTEVNQPPGELQPLVGAATCPSPITGNCRLKREEPGLSKAHSS